MIDGGATASLIGEMNRLISYSLFIVSAASGARLYFPIKSSYDIP
jgi:hypothetical protein